MTVAPTAWQLRRWRAPRCPSCTHGARMWRLETLYAWACRWGHITAEADREHRHPSSPVVTLGSAA